MQRSLLASLIIMSLSACDSDSLVTPIDTGTETEVTDTGTPVIPQGGDTDSGDNGSDTADNGDSTNDDASGDDSTQNNDDADGGNSDNGQNTDDSGSSTSDSGQNTDDSGSSTSDSGQNTDDSGSDTSDSGQNTDDSGSSTSDGGQNTDDSGSSTSDGGQNSDDSGSSTSDGGQNGDDSGSSSSDGGDNSNDTTGERNTDAGDFTSDNSGGTVFRTSALPVVAQQSICTTLDDRNDYSDTRVGDFILHNNAWRPWRAFPGYEWSQCITTNTNGAKVGWNYDWGPGRTGINGNSQASGDYYVRSYPELIFGVKDEFRTSASKDKTGLPVKLSEMPNISIDYAYTGPQYGGERIVDASNNARFPNGSTIQGERNVAIESFFYEDETGQCNTDIVKRSGGSNHVYEVMVWLDAGAERLPAGPGDFVADLNIRGEAYKVYTKGSDTRYVAFVAQNPQLSGTVYWNDFVDWAKDNAHQVKQRFGAASNSDQIQDDWCMANIIVGTEIFWGAGDVNFNTWTINQSR